MRSGYWMCFFLLASALAGVSQKGGAAPPSAFQHYSIDGIVLDQGGKAVEGAYVMLVDPETNYRAQPVVTNSRGQFTFPELTASTYRLQATKSNLRSNPMDVTVGPGAPRPFLQLVVQ